MKNRSSFKYFAWILMLLPLSCSSPPKAGVEEGQSSIASNVDAIPLSVPVEFAEDLNAVVNDIGVMKDEPIGVPLADASTIEQSQLDDPIHVNDSEKTSSIIKDATSEEVDKSKRSIASLNGKEITYEVKSGDTLMKIAFEVFGDLTRWKEILQTNQNLVMNPNVLSKGMKLKIKVFGAVAVKKNGEPYLIKKGDTLGKISNWVYGTISHWKLIWNNNKELIHNPNKIYAGFKLFYIKKNEKPNLDDQ